MIPFPAIIRNINQILPLIEGKKEFIVVKKDTFTIINYVLAGEETFPSFMKIPSPNSSNGEEFFDAARFQAEVATGIIPKEIIHNIYAAIYRELRGIKFCNETGKVIARPLHKFFNFGEREETSIINFNRPHTILQKLDGSMVHPIAIPDAKGVKHIRWCTKMGITHTSMNAECFIAANPEYNAFAKEMIEQNRTPIFEWESPKDQIVVKQTKESMTLLAIRNNEYGEYIPYHEMVERTALYTFPIVKRVEIDSHNIVEQVRKYEDQEGIIIRFDNGEMIKIKSDWYVQLHRAKDLIRDQRNVVEIILDDKIDDLIPTLDDNAKPAVKYFRSEWLRLLQTTADMCVNLTHRMKEEFPTRKDFALGNPLGDFNRAIVFKLWDDNRSEIAYELLQTLARKSLSKIESYQTFKSSCNLPDLEVIMKQFERKANV